MDRLTVDVDGFEVDGKALADKCGLPWQVVYKRLRRGMSVADAFSRPTTEAAPTKPAHERIAEHRRRATWHIEQANRLQAKLEAEQARIAVALARQEAKYTDDDDLSH